METLCDDVIVRLSRFDIWPRSYPDLSVEVNKRWRIEKRMSIQDIFGVVISAKCCDFYTQKEALCGLCKGPGGKLLRVLIKEHIPVTSASGETEVFQFTIKQFCSSPKTHINTSELVLLIDFGGGSIASTKKFRLVARDYHKKPAVGFNGSALQSLESSYRLRRPSPTHSPPSHTSPSFLISSSSSSPSMVEAAEKYDNHSFQSMLQIGMAESPRKRACTPHECNITPEPQQCITTPQIQARMHSNVAPSYGPPIVVRILHSTCEESITKAMIQSATSITGRVGVCLNHVSARCLTNDSEAQAGYNIGRIAVTVSSYKTVLDALAGMIRAL
ncbi:hypothetical protein Pelo_7677 [Pelomyxa schiedti]|nr:hypothetical protein Pelo_7677 [Pelomyxa schiedti]